MVGQGGRTGTGGAGGGGGTVVQGGSTGTTTIPPIDLTCNTDDDCCVESDTCRSVVVLYSKLQGLVYWPPSTTTECLRCYTPVIEVSCKNNQCTGMVTNANGYSGIAGVESHCGKLPGTGGATSPGAGGATSLGTGGATSPGAGGATSLGTGGATSRQATLAIKASPAPLPPADLPPMYGCGI
jgi:hypothetical protein